MGYEMCTDVTMGETRTTSASKHRAHNEKISEGNQVIQELKLEGEDHTALNSNVNEGCPPLRRSVLLLPQVSSDVVDHLGEGERCKKWVTNGSGIGTGWGVHRILVWVLCGECTLYCRLAREVQGIDGEG